MRLAGSPRHQNFSIASHYFDILCAGVKQDIFPPANVAEAGEQLVDMLAHHEHAAEAEQEYRKLLALPFSAAARFVGNGEKWRTREMFRFRHFQAQAANRLISFWHHEKNSAKANAIYKELHGALSGDTIGEAYRVSAAKALVERTGKTADTSLAILNTLYIPENIFVTDDHGNIAMLDDKYVDSDMLLLRQDYLALYLYTASLAAREGRAALVEKLYAQSAQWPQDEQTIPVRKHMEIMLREIGSNAK